MIIASDIWDALPDVCHFRNNGVITRFSKFTHPHLQDLDDDEALVHMQWKGIQSKDEYLDWLNSLTRAHAGHVAALSWALELGWHHKLSDPRNYSEDGKYTGTATPPVLPGSTQEVEETLESRLSVENFAFSMGTLLLAGAHNININTSEVVCDPSLPGIRTMPANMYLPLPKETKQKLHELGFTYDNESKFLIFTPK